jgi:hypothetical protein
MKRLNKQNGFDPSAKLTQERKLYDEIELAAENGSVYLVNIYGKYFIGSDLTGEDYLRFNDYKEKDGNTKRAAPWLFLQRHKWVWERKSEENEFSSNSIIRKSSRQDWNKLDGLDQAAFIMASVNQDVTCNDDKPFAQSKDFSIFVNSNEEEPTGLEVEFRFTIAPNSGDALMIYQSTASVDPQLALKRVIKKIFLLNGEPITDEDFLETIKHGGLGYEGVAVCASRFQQTISGGKFKGQGKALPFRHRPTLSDSLSGEDIESTTLPDGVISTT